MPDERHSSSEPEQDRSRSHSKNSLSTPSLLQEFFSQVETIRRHSNRHDVAEALERAEFQGSEQTLRIIQNLESQLLELYNEDRDENETLPPSSLQKSTEPGPCLYDIKPSLARKFGLASGQDVTDLVTSLQCQLEALYEQKQRFAP